VNRLEIDVATDGFVTEMRIDGQPLIDLVSVIEAAQSSDRVSYDYLHANQITSPARRLLGEAEDDFAERDNLVYLLECDCRCAGCSPLMVRIDVGESTVAWSGFQQYRHPNWRYDLRFEFDRADYERALGFPA
jgi:hypothetical protein